MEPCNYKIIAFEGIDGSGKTTLIDKLDKYLMEKYRYRILKEKLAPKMVEIYKELFDVPSGKTGEYQRSIPEDFRFASYIFESAVQMRTKDIEYRNYDAVIFDRWLQTNMAYLSDINWHKEYFQMIIDIIPKPDVIFYLDVDTEKAIERLSARNDWMIERFDGRELYQRLSEYKYRFHQVFEGYNVKIINANEDLESTFNKVLNEMATFLKL